MGARDSGRASLPPTHRRLPTDSRTDALPLLHVDGNHLTRAGHCVVQVVAELQRELVLAGRQLAVEHVLAVAEVDPRRSAFDDVLAGGQAILVDADVIMRDAGARLLRIAG